MSTIKTTSDFFDHYSQGINFINPRLMPNQGNLDFLVENKEFLLQTKKSCYALAQFTLGKYLLETDKKDDDIVKLLSSSAKSNLPEANEILSFMHYYGFLVEKDIKIAEKYAKKAAKQQISSALKLLSELQKSESKSKESLERSNFIIGCDHLYGNVMASIKDLETLPLMKKLSSIGHPPSQFCLGSFYYFGDLVPKDHALAKSWYLKSAENGNVEAMHFLSILFRNENDNINSEKWMALAKTKTQSDLPAKVFKIHKNLVF